MGTGGRHVLIIEDEMLIALEIEALLSELGFRSFDFVDTPARAATAATAHRPDLLTADYRIIDGTGVEAVAGVWSAIGRVPVVYVTGNAEFVERHSALPVVDKPIQASALAAACRRALAFSHD